MHSGLLFSSDILVWIWHWTPATRCESGGGGGGDGDGPSVIYTVGGQIYVLISNDADITLSKVEHCLCIPATTVAITYASNTFSRPHTTPIQHRWAWFRITVDAINIGNKISAYFLNFRVAIAWYKKISQESHPLQGKNVILTVEE